MLVLEQLTVSSVDKGVLHAGRGLVRLLTAMRVAAVKTTTSCASR